MRVAVQGYYSRSSFDHRLVAQHVDVSGFAGAELQSEDKAQGVSVTGTQGLEHQPLHAR
jgi:hypothetical protein